MHNKPKNKIKLHKLIAMMLCVIMMIAAFPLYQIVIAAPATAMDSEWIKAANKIMADQGSDEWSTYLTSKLYGAVSFSSDGSGVLSWNSITLPAGQVWDGTEAGSTLPTVAGNQIAFDGVSTYTYNGAQYTSELNAQKAAAMANPDMVAPLETSKKTYYAYSPQQMLYSFRKLNDTSNNSNYTVEIMRDFDMNGMNYRWPTGINLEDYTTIHGNGHTIYNLGMLANYIYTAMISQCTSLKMDNLSFCNANICNQNTNSHTAVLIARPYPYNQVNWANFWDLDTISFKNCLVLSNDGAVGTLIGRFQCNVANNTEAKIQKCSVINCVVTGVDHVGTLTGPILKLGLVDRCFSIGCTDISYGTHSGGLFSCTGGIERCSRCFVDAKVFGSAQTGVFSGNTNGITNIYDCYSSGFIEGVNSLGGFNGTVDINGCTCYFNCYSTALVGLRSSGSGLGGFFGKMSTSSGKYQGFVNCYAAGEVGSADTISSGAKSGGTHKDSSGNIDYIGGFAGLLRGPMAGATPTSSVSSVLAYCYYDKQTTAMREWDLGNNTLQIATTRTSSSITQLKDDWLGVSSGCQGLRGVLTTDTNKSGAGLTGTPKEGTGFTGFADLTQLYDNRGLYKSGWDYSAANHYPELSVFSKATEADWGKYASLIRDYSKASTSTIELETWEKALDKESGTLVVDPSTTATYDTVRDLTVRFNCTGDSNEYSWNRIASATGTVGENSNVNGATVTIAGKEDIPVATLNLKAMNLNGEEGNFYYADEFAPGLEWLSVTYGQAERRLRFMPTVGIEAGESKTIYRPSEYAPNSVKDAAFYDHANDVEMYYSTADRLDKNINDITTGIYPDASGTNVYAEDHMTKTADLLTNRQQLLMSGSTDESISDYFTTQHTNDSYGLITTPSFKHVGVDVSFMSRAQSNKVDELVLQTNNANGSRLFIYAREITSIDSNGALNTGNGLVDFTYSAADTYNGLALTAHGDQMLMFQYIWELYDGRIVTDAKLITVRATPFSAKITAYDAGGTNSQVNKENKLADDQHDGLIDTNDLFVDVQRLFGNKNDDQVATIMDGFTPVKRKTDYLYPYSVDPNDSSIIIPAEDVGPEYIDSMVASWKINNSDKVVTKIIVRMDSGIRDGQNNKIYFTSEVNPALTNKVVVPYKYYRYVTSEDGSFYVQEETLDREYEIHQTSSGVYYLAFNKYIVDDPTVRTEQGPVDVIDTANNIEVTVELSAVLNVEKKVTGDYGDANQLFDFDVSFDDGIGRMVKYNYYITHLDGSKTDTDSSNKKLTITDDGLTIKMKHGDKLTIVGLPYGTTYSALERDYSSVGYMTTTDSVAGRNAEGTLSVDALETEDGIFVADRKHIVTNDKSMIPSLGVNLPDAVPFLLIVLFCIVGCIMVYLHNRRKRKYIA